MGWIGERGGRRCQKGQGTVLKLVVARGKRVEIREALKIVWDLWGEFL